MKTRTLDPALIEPERYELQAEIEADLDVDRRGFFGAMGGGLVVLSLLSEAGAQEPARAKGGRRGGGGAAPREIGAWIHIGEDGNVTAFTGKMEEGQNIRTSLSQGVAEELRVPVARVKLVMADTALSPFDMGTFGSRTTPAMLPQMRSAAAAARLALIDLAAEKWKVERASLVATDGHIKRNDTGETIGYGELTHGQKLLKTIGPEASTTPADKWEVLGHPTPKVNGRAYVTGGHQYASDIKREGMRYGKVIHPPGPGAKLLSADEAAANAIPGVTIVRDGDFLALVAPGSHLVRQAVEALKPKWSPSNGSSDQTLFNDLHPEESKAVGETQSTKEGWKSLVARYTVAYIAHAPMEPRAAVAEWQDGKLTVWTGTSRPFGVKGELTQALGIPDANVRVIVPDTGGGYGGKHTGEAAVEAAKLARAVKAPVKVIWTREDEFAHAYLRPAGVIEASAAVHPNGTISRWSFDNYNSGGSGIDSPYRVESPRQAFHQTKSPLRQGSYRALASTANHFARESFMDELAHVAGLDPLEFRLKNIREPRLRAVLTAAADKFGWGKRPSRDGITGSGLACGTEKGGFVGTAAEVEIDAKTGRVHVRRLVVAFECGAITNPDGVKNQAEGGVIMGLGGALFEAIKFKDGAVANARFSKYRVPRFSDVPPIEIVLLDRKDLPSAGAGEAPIIGVAPAIGNAIFNATGRRLRAIPMVPEGLKV